MKKKSSGSKLVVDIKIHYHGRVYCFAIGRLLRWLLPIAIIAARLLARIKDTSG